MDAVVMEAAYLTSANAFGIRELNEDTALTVLWTGKLLCCTLGVVWF